MHFSTSNSKNTGLAGETAAARMPDGNWTRVWLVGLVLALLIAGCMEAYWRSRGYQPVLVDDLNLWCLQREIVDENKETVALLGSSRMALGFVPDVLRRAYPRYQVANLSLEGTNPIGVLRDLASDEKFHGVVLVDCPPFGMQHRFWYSLQDHIDYYHSRWNPVQKLDRYLASFVQSHLVLLRVELDLRNISIPKEDPRFCPTCSTTTAR